MKSKILIIFALILNIKVYASLSPTGYYESGDLKIYVQSGRRGSQFQKAKLFSYYGDSLLTNLGFENTVVIDFAEWSKSEFAVHKGVRREDRFSLMENAYPRFPPDSNAIVLFIKDKDFHISNYLKLLEHCVMERKSHKRGKANRLFFDSNKLNNIFNSEPSRLVSSILTISLCIEPEESDFLICYNNGMYEFKNKSEDIIFLSLPTYRQFASFTSGRPTGVVFENDSVFYMLRDSYDRYKPTPHKIPYGDKIFLIVKVVPLTSSLAAFSYHYSLSDEECLEYLKDIGLLAGSKTRLESQNYRFNGVFENIMIVDFLKNRVVMNYLN